MELLIKKCVCDLVGDRKMRVKNGSLTRVMSHRFLFRPFVLFFMFSVRFLIFTLELPIMDEHPIHVVTLE